MFRNAAVLKAMAALLLVSAIAMFCVLDSEPSDAAEGLPPHGGSVPGPWDSRGPSPDVFGEFLAAGPSVPFGPHPQERPRYVIDAPDRPAGMPERLIDDYGRMFEEKRGLEWRGAEVFVYDPLLEEDAGKDLAEIIRAVMDGAVVSERPGGAEAVSPSSLPDTYDVAFLGLLLEQAGEGTELGQLISAMMAQRLASGSGSEGAAPSSGREDGMCAALSELADGDEDDEDDMPFVDAVSEHTPSSESYLVEHGFDGGTSF